MAKVFNVLVTREPGGTLIGDQIRLILSDLDNTEMRPRTETCSSWRRAPRLSSK